MIRISSWILEKSNGFVLIGEESIVAAAECLGVVKSWIFYRLFSVVTTEFKMDLPKSGLRISEILVISSLCSTVDRSCRTFISV